MEFKYEIWEDVKEPIVEGYDIDLWLIIFLLALTFLSLWDEEFGAGDLASIYVGWPKDPELVQNIFALVNWEQEGPLKGCMELIHSRIAKQISFN